MSVHAAWREHCLEQVQALVSQTGGIESAAVVTGDGFEVASALRAGLAGDKLAAMTSSLLALGEAIVRELRMRSCRSVIIETEAGAMVVVRVPTSDVELILCVLCSQSVSLGAVLFASRAAADAICARCRTTEPA